MRDKTTYLVFLKVLSKTIYRLRMALLKRTDMVLDRDSFSKKKQKQRLLFQKIKTVCIIFFIKKKNRVFGV